MMSFGELFDLVKQDGLGHTPQAKKNLRLVMSALADTLNSHFGALNDVIAACKFRRLGAGAGRERVSNGIHAAIIQDLPCYINK